MPASEESLTTMISIRRGMLPRGRAGFTLVELAIVFVIIGILASIAIPGYGRMRERARRGSCVSNQRNLVVCATLYATDTHIADQVVSVHDLFVAGYVPAGLSECPESNQVDNDDYEITFEQGRVTDIDCTVNAADHAWTP